MVALIVATSENMNYYSLQTFHLTLIAVFQAEVQTFEYGHGGAPPGGFPAATEHHEHQGYEYNQQVSCSFYKSYMNQVDLGFVTDSACL